MTWGSIGVLCKIRFIEGIISLWIIIDHACLIHLTLIFKKFIDLDQTLYMLLDSSHFTYRKHHQIVLRDHHSYLAPFNSGLVDPHCCTYGGSKVSPLNCTTVVMSISSPPKWSFMVLLHITFGLSDEVQFMLLFWLRHICFLSATVLCRLSDLAI